MVTNNSLFSLYIQYLMWNVQVRHIFPLFSRITLSCREYILYQLTRVLDEAVPRVLLVLAVSSHLNRGYRTEATLLLLRPAIHYIQQSLQATFSVNIFILDFKSNINGLLQQEKGSPVKNYLLIPDLLINKFMKNVVK